MRRKIINPRRPAYRDPEIVIPENPLEREFYENELPGSQAYVEEEKVIVVPKRVCNKFYEKAIYGKKYHQRNRQIRENYKDILDASNERD